MDVDHPHFGQLRGRGDRAGNRVRNVVELEIEKYLEAQTRELFNRPRAFSRKELQPNLKQACRTAKPPRQGAGRPQAVDVQGYD